MPPQTLLNAWRKPDALGRECANCHAPDGLDLASGAYSESDIERRALRHLAPDDAKQAVQLVLWMRRRIREPLRNIDQPLMQPGGSVLPGSTPAERDSHLGPELVALVPGLGQPIRSRRAADELRAQLLKLNLMQLQVGFSMSKLSADGFRGNNQAQIDEWLPENSIPGKPSQAGLQDQYLAHPNWATLFQLEEAIVKLPPAKSQADVLARAKLMALLIFQHRLRMEQGLAPDEPMPAEFLPRLGLNPFWEVGDCCRLMTNFSIGSIGLAPDVLQEKRLGPDFKKQMESMQVSWLWLGFVMDPSLENSGPKKDVPRAQYLVSALIDQGPYWNHICLLLAKKTAEQFHSAAVSTAPADGFQFEFDPLLYRASLSQALKKLGPGGSQSIRMYRSMFEAALYWEAELLEGNRPVLYLEDTLAQTKLIAQFLAETGDSRKSLCNAVMVQLQKRIKKRT